MIKIDAFLNTIREFGFEEAEARLLLHPVQAYVSEADVKRVVEYFWKDNTGAASETQQRISQMIYKAALEKKASNAELKVLFNDIDSRVERGERGIDLALEMRMLGFKPVIQAFDFVHLRHLIIDNVIFINCNACKFEKCLIRNSLLSNETLVDCVYTESERSLVSFGQIRSQIKEIMGKDDVNIFIQAIMDFHSSQIEKKEFKEMLGDEFLHTNFLGDGTDIWKKFFMFCGEIYPQGTLLSMRKFGISDHQFLVDQIKNMMIHKGVETVTRMDNCFKIFDDAAKIDIVTFAAKIDGLHAAKLIEYIGITNEEALFNIAIECLNHTTDSDCFWIFNRTIKNAKILKNLVLEYLKKDCDSVIERFSQLNITDQKELTEIAIQCARLRPLLVNDRANDFAIKDKAALACIAKECLYGIVKEEKTDAIFSNMFQNCEQISGVLLVKEVSQDTEFDLKQNMECLDSIRNDQALNQTAFWLAFTIAFLNSISQQQKAWVNDTQILLHMQKIEDPEIRKRVSRCLFRYMNRGMEKDFPDIMVENPNTGKGKKALKALYLIELIIQVLLLKDASLPVNLIRQNSKMFVEDTNKLNVFLNAFSHVALESQLMPRDIKRRMIDVFTHSNLTIKRLKKLYTIFNLDCCGYVCYHNGSIDETFNQVLQSKMNEIITLNNSVTDKLLSVFEDSRNPNALYIYFANLNKLKDNSVINAARELIHSILDDKFYKLRYDCSKNKHLKKIDPTLLSKWKANQEFKLDEVVNQLPLIKKEFNFKDWLIEKLVIDKHYPAEKIPVLYNYLETGKLSSEKLDDVQSICFELLNENSTAKLEQLQMLVAGTEFENDIKSITTKRRKVSTDAVIVDTDNLIDILLCGTDVPGSCQRVDGNPDKNKGLLGYLMNGQTRLLAIKSKAGSHGTIHARCLLRLLWDDVEKIPVLFRERSYPTMISSQMLNALNELAQRKANELGLRLVTDDSRYPNSLSSFGGWSPCEYVDAMRQGVVSSEYTIKKERG